MRLRYIAVNLLNIFMAVVEGFLALRFLLKLFGANAGNAFVAWIYDMSAVLLEPFRGIFPATVFESKYVLEFSTLFAMMMYAIVGLLLLFLINLVSAAADSDADDVERTEVVTKKRR